MSEHRSYNIPANSISIEYEIKRSRFIADVAHITSKQEAIEFIQQMRNHYPDARHHCWAYIAGHPVESIERGMSDDGEPQGTAGKPMLNVLQHKKIGEIIIVISRYFGGIKLGAGGLVRAYSNASQLAMDALPLKQLIATTTINLTLPFDMENSVRHLLEKHDISITSCDYQQQVFMQAEVANNIKKELKDALTNLGRGKITIIFPKESE